MPSAIGSPLFASQVECWCRDGPAAGGEWRGRVRVHVFVFEGGDSGEEEGKDGRMSIRAATRFQSTAVAYSPWNESSLAVGSAQHFGIVGNGCQSVFVLQPRGLVESRQFLTQDAVLDCCWSECNANQLISACGDGSLKLWDLSLPGTRPLIAFKEHLKEVHAVSWNLVNKDSFLSASWDGQVKHWSPASPQSLATWRLPAQGSVYSVAWSPRWASTFATGSQDKMLKVFDGRSPQPALLIPGHTHEVLSIDWCNCLTEGYIGAADSTARVWDLRRPHQARHLLTGHRFAVRRVRFSPYYRTQVLTCSYDLTVALWETQGGGATLHARGVDGAPIGAQSGGLCVRRWAHHKEFVTGIDFNLFVQGQVASCSWDRSVSVWQLS